MGNFFGFYRHTPYLQKKSVDTASFVEGNSDQNFFVIFSAKATKKLRYVLWSMNRPGFGFSTLPFNISEKVISVSILHVFSPKKIKPFSSYV